MIRAVPFRDDRDALLARADALQRERDRLAAELADESSTNRALERELAKAEKDLARARRRADGAPSIGKRVWIAAAIVAVMAVVALVISARSRAPDGDERDAVADRARPHDAAVAPPPDAAPTPAELARRALVAKDAAYRACLDRVDHQLRIAWLDYGVRQARDRLAKWEKWVGVDTDEMKACARGIEQYADREPAYGVTDDLAAQYAREIRVFAISMDALAGYRELYEYRDDDGSRGLAIHADLVAALGALMRTSEDFRAMYAPHHAGAMRARVSRMHALDDNTVRYWTESLRARAVSLVDLVTLSDTSSATLEVEITLAVEAIARADSELDETAGTKAGKTVTARMRSLVDAIKRVRTEAGEVERDLIDVSRRAVYRRVVKALETLVVTYDRLADRELERLRRRTTKP